jgi:hypothetical protein
MLVYRNEVEPGRHWIQFELEGLASPTPAGDRAGEGLASPKPAGDRAGEGGLASNRSAIGARVELHWNGVVQAQEVAAAAGFSAQNQRRLHYGLGAAGAVDRVVIRWPSGATQTIERPEVDRLHRVREPDGR